MTWSPAEGNGPAYRFDRVLARKTQAAVDGSGAEFLSTLVLQDRSLSLRPPAVGTDHRGVQCAFDLRESRATLLRRRRRRMGRLCEQAFVGAWGVLAWLGDPRRTRPVPRWSRIRSGEKAGRSTTVRSTK